MNSINRAMRPARLVLKADFWEMFKKVVDKHFQNGIIAIRKGFLVTLLKGLGKLKSSEAARVFLDKIYPRLYFSLPRLPAKPSGTRLNERLFSILMLLELKSREGQVLTIGDIGEIGKLSASDTTRKIKDLEKRGLVRKSNVKADDRLKEVTLTEQGIQILLAERETRAFWFERFFQALEEEERISIIDIFSRISEKVEAFKIAR